MSIIILIFATFSPFSAIWNLFSFKNNSHWIIEESSEPEKRRWFPIISSDLIKDATSKASQIVVDAKGSATHEAEVTVFNSEDKAKKEANQIKNQAKSSVESIKANSSVNVDEAASVIVEKLL